MECWLASSEYLHIPFIYFVLLCQSRVLMRIKAEKPPMISRPQSPFYQRNNRLEKWKYLIDVHLLFYYLLEEISTPLY